MTTTDALRWANARSVDRWRMVAAVARVHEDQGDRYAQMDADAMSTLAAEVERWQKRWATLRQRVAAPEGGELSPDYRTVLTWMRELEGENG